MRKATESSTADLSSKVKILACAGVAAVLAISFVAYFILQSSYEQQIRSTIFEQQKELQILYARSVAKNIGSDLDSLMAKMQVLEGTGTIQDGDFASAKANRLLQQTYNESLAIGKIDGVFLANQNGIIVNYVSNSLSKPQFIGYNLSNLPAYKEYLSNNRNPTFSNAYISPVDGILRIALFYPIYNQDTGQYIGTIRESLVLHDFLHKYGNLDDINSQYLVILDRNATVLDTPIKTSIGQNFFGNGPQQGASQISNEHYKIVLSGQEHTAVYGYRNLGDRINTGEPVIIGGKPEYFVFLVTPTTSIYAQIDSLIAEQRTGFYLLQIGIATAIAISLFFLVRWSGVLERAVRQRTSDLLHANQQLETRDKMQSEFINIAAHELRTPVQPLRGMADIMMEEYQKSKNGKIEINKEDVEMIARNAARLERLTSDLLDVSRIESNNLKLNKEIIDLDEKIRNVVRDERNAIPKGKELAIVFEQKSTSPLLVEGDKSRLFETLSNLIGNAIKFTDNGTITITSDRDDSGSKAIITIKDTGKGIDPDIMPMLFTKFASKSDKGTGLGLYLAKSIIEAHGGTIWAENNNDGKGATFAFSIPILMENRI